MANEQSTPGQWAERWATVMGGEERRWESRGVSVAKKGPDLREGGHKRQERGRLCRVGGQGLLAGSLFSAALQHLLSLLQLLCQQQGWAAASIHLEICWGVRGGAWNRG